LMYAFAHIYNCLDDFSPRLGFCVTLTRVSIDQSDYILLFDLSILINVPCLLERCICWSMLLLIRTLLQSLLPAVVSTPLPPSGLLCLCRSRASAGFNTLFSLLCKNVCKCYCTISSKIRDVEWHRVIECRLIQSIERLFILIVCSC
jgi:hypothetical protein